MAGKAVVRTFVLVLLLLVLPLFVGNAVRAAGWMVVFGQKGVLNAGLAVLGLAPQTLMYTPAAVFVGILSVNLPFVVLTLASVLEGLDRSVDEAALSLGASPAAGFRLVTLPLAMPGLVAGTLLTFIPASGDYINAELLGNPTTRMIGNDIQALFNAQSLPAAASLSVTLMAAIVVIVLVYVRRAGTEELV